VNGTAVVVGAGIGGLAAAAALRRAGVDVTRL
jgi:cation diffusion facilitator CzcD-associated flavoprotein CzcO